MKKYSKENILYAVNEIEKFTDCVGNVDDTPEYIGSCVSEEFYDALHIACNILLDVAQSNK